MAISFGAVLFTKIDLDLVLQGSIEKALCTDLVEDHSCLNQTPFEISKILVIFKLEISSIPSSCVSSLEDA